LSESIDTLVFINNALSSRLMQEELARKGIHGRQVALFLLRRLRADWYSDCTIVVDYGRPPARTMLGQIAVSGFYRRAAGELRRLLASGRIRRIYLVNNDSLLTNHVIGWARDRTDCEVVVVVEGLMNFQDIRLRNRQSWRSRVKRLVAPLLGLSWSPPDDHLSGAFDRRVDRVLTFERRGLKAPAAKIDEQRLTALVPPPRRQERTVLVVLSGIWQWLEADEDRKLNQGFVAWLAEQGFDRILVKPHPHVSAGALDELLPSHERLEVPQSLEDMAATIEAGTVAGICCTGLVTLKLLRPDLRCVDYGTRYYCEHAYFGDRSVEDVMRSAGVEIVPF
jgi:hypothetical protein